MTASTQGIGRKMAKGAAWMVGFKLAERSIGMVSTIILARILVPEDFGLIAMATAVIAVVEILQAFGFDVALIQNQQATREDYDTAWTLNIPLAASRALLLAAAANPMAVPPVQRNVVYVKTRQGHTACSRKGGGQFAGEIPFPMDRPAWPHNKNPATWAGSVISGSFVSSCCCSLLVIISSACVVSPTPSRRGQHREARQSRAREPVALRPGRSYRQQCRWLRPGETTTPH